MVRAKAESWARPRLNISGLVWSRRVYIHWLGAGTCALRHCAAVEACTLLQAPECIALLRFVQILSLSGLVPGGRGPGDVHAWFGLVGCRFDGVAIVCLSSVELGNGFG